jgi:hypothetical protein
MWQRFFIESTSLPRRRRVLAGDNASLTRAMTVGKQVTDGTANRMLHSK